jgi:hypothetical protein
MLVLGLPWPFELTATVSADELILAAGREAGLSDRQIKTALRGQQRAARQVQTGNRRASEPALNLPATTSMIDPPAFRNPAIIRLPKRDGIKGVAVSAKGSFLASVDCCRLISAISSISSGAQAELPKLPTKASNNSCLVIRWSSRSYSMAASTSGLRLGLSSDGAVTG